MKYTNEEQEDGEKKYIYKNPLCLQLLWFSKFSLHGPNQHIELSEPDDRCSDHGCQNTLKTEEEEV